MVLACAKSDSDGVVKMSMRLGFLTGMEKDVMLDAYIQAGFIVGLPFSRPAGFDFPSSNTTQSISHLGATMLKHRLTPPPDEAYSQQRKLSGVFLACIKIGGKFGATVRLLLSDHEITSSNPGNSISICEGSVHLLSPYPTK